MIRIAMVDDHPIVPAGLRQFFTDHRDLDVAEAANGRGALDLVRMGGIDVMLMDLSMGGQGRVEAMVAIKTRAPDLPVLILSALPETHCATALLQRGERLPEQGL